PEWLKCALKYIIAEKVGAQAWVDLINMWVELERRLGFPSPDSMDLAHRLGKKNRPEEVSVWIRNGRPYNKPPEIFSVTEYADYWQKWWTALQPAWRSDRGEDWPLSRDLKEAIGERWPGVAKGGKNGFHMIIVTLLWW
ncbi:hypothetical protein BD410DRAFT_694689, partial [Rickenella mellea]